MGRERWPEAERFEEYLGLLSEAIGHADRREPLRAYLTGLVAGGRAQEH